MATTSLPTTGRPSISTSSITATPTPTTTGLDGDALHVAAAPPGCFGDFVPVTAACRSALDHPLGDRAAPPRTRAPGKDDNCGGAFLNAKLGIPAAMQVPPRRPCLWTALSTTRLRRVWFHFTRTSSPGGAYTGGDFNGDGVTDDADFVFRGELQRLFLPVRHARLEAGKRICAHTQPEAVADRTGDCRIRQRGTVLIDGPPVRAAKRASESNMAATAREEPFSALGGLLVSCFVYFRHGRHASTPGGVVSVRLSGCSTTCPLDGLAASPRPGPL